MKDLTQEEKELIIVCIGNSISDNETDPDFKVNAIKLYDELRQEWLADPSSYHTAKEIIDIAVGG